MSGVWLPLLCNCCCCLARAFHFCLHFRCGECWACAAACEAVHLHTQHRTHADIEACTACSALQSYLSFQMRCCMRCECVLDRIEFSRHHRREAVFRRLHSHKQRSVWLFCVFIFHLSPASRNHETNDARKRTFALSRSLHEFLTLCIRVVWCGNFGVGRCIRSRCTLCRRILSIVCSFIYCSLHGSTCVGRRFAFTENGLLSAPCDDGRHGTHRNTICSVLSTHTIYC